jgi:hypothetical protein
MPLRAGSAAGTEECNRDRQTTRADTGGVLAAQLRDVGFTSTTAGRRDQS